MLQKFRKPQTPAQRIVAANERVGTALFVFEQAANELELVRDENHQIASDLLTEAAVLKAQVDALKALSEQADVNANDADARASKMRALLA